MSQPICYKCKFRGNVPGDAHSCCRYPGTSTTMFDFFNVENMVIAKKLNIIAERRGVEMGWFIWPINFDPIWLINCNGFLDKEENYVLHKLPENYDVDSKISFHKHTVKDGISETQKLDLKYDIINIGEDRFVKAYVNNVDGLDIHFLIKGKHE